MLFTQSKQSLRLAATIALVLLLGVCQSAYAATTKVSHTSVMTHGESSGGKGLDVFKLKAPKLTDSSCAVFVDAAVDYEKRRFGEAKVVAQPDKGCNPAKSACKLSVSWKHAPAGRLNYRVTTNWKVQSGDC